MRIGLIAAFLLATAAAQAWTGEPEVRFLSSAEASAALTGGNERSYYAQLQMAEMRAKTGLEFNGLSLEAARDAARKAYGAATRDFSDDERAALRDAVESMQPVLAAKAPLYARTPWCFIKVGAAIEGGLPHTRGRCIVLAESVVASLAQAHAKAKFDHASGVWLLLLHEQSHVLQRQHPALFATLYTQVFGFRKAALVPPDWLRERRVINPDAPAVEWIYPLGAGAARHWIVPDIELSSLEHPRMPEDFKIVALGVHEARHNHWVVDDAIMPAAQTDLESVAGYVDAFPVKGEAFHPNEIAAQMLAELIAGGKMQNPDHPLWGRTRQWAAQALQ
ncbi:MAG TPA: hypothetical protein VMT49_02825 [Steroidobacteraceae bacterium]|nr:hypothetical protein [Steroidobacteraceae bacterium]